MARVDEKLAENIAAEMEAQAERNEVEEFFDSLGSLTEDQRDERQDALRKIDLQLQDSLIEIDPKEWGQNISQRVSDPIQQVAYGTCRMGGSITFLRADTAEGEAGEFLHVFITYAGHQIEDIDKIIFDGEQVTFPSGFGWANGAWSNLVFASVGSKGSVSQTVNGDLKGQSDALFPGQWGSSHKQGGSAGVYLILKYDAGKFISGFPEIALEGRWKNDIYDPRDKSTGYSNNAALCLVNYMTDTKHGPGVKISEFDEDNLKYAADICDELVSLSGGGSEKRYTINGSFQASKQNSHEKIIESMRFAMAGELVRSGGKYFLFPGAWRQPTVSLSEKDLRSSVRIRTKPSKRSVFNGVKGLYRSSATNWELSDYPPVKNELYKEQDGERLWRELNLPFTTSPSMAQRIAKIILEEGRQWQEIEAEFSLAAFQVRGGDNIKLSLERFGFNEKPYKIKGFDFIVKTGSSGPVAHCKMLLRETSSAVFDWNNGEETVVDLAPNTELPLPGNVATPSGLGNPAELLLESGNDQLYLRSDGTVFSRLKIEWAPSTDPFVITGGFHEIQYRLTGQTEWLPGAIVPGVSSKAFLLDVQDGGIYDVRVRAATPLGRSNWLERLGYTVEGKTDPPSTPTNFRIQTSRQGIKFFWDEVLDLDILDYEIRVGPSWAGGQTIYQGAADTALWETQLAGSYMFMLRARDTSRNYSDSSVVETLTIGVPSQVRNLNAVSIYNMVRIDWEEPTTFAFPINVYKIYKGETFAGATLLGEAAATIKTFQEQLSGTFTYWITAVDIHGNEGVEDSIIVKVTAPPLFVLLYDQVLDLANLTTLTNAEVENSSIVAPLDTNISYSDAFTDNSWDTPQDRIDAGYPIYAQPSSDLTAVYEQKIDYGESIPSALIVVQDAPVWASGSGTITKTISYSNDDITYTDTVGVNEVYGETFRYVKVKYEIDGDDDTSLVNLPAPRIRLEVRSDEEEGIVSADSTDTNGTLVVFTETFLDILEDKITVTYKGSNAYFAGYTVTTNDLRVFLWDTSGNRVSGDVKYTVKGVVAA